ncbi:MAG: putative oxidoreductase [Patescibacteria group bacterium]|jgi:putative oxidoreductase
MVNKFLDSNKENFYFLFRIVVGLMFFMHGAGKLLGWFGGTVASSKLMWAAGIIEFTAGLLITLGFWTQIAAAISAITMLVAYLMVHASWANFWNPLANKGETALLYLVAMLVLAAYGPGKWSLRDCLDKK